MSNTSAPSQPKQIATFIALARQEGFAFALPTSEAEAVAEQISEQEAETIEDREPELKTMSLLDLMEAAEPATPEKQEFRIAIAVAADAAQGIAAAGGSSEDWRATGRCSIPKKHARFEGRAARP